MGTFEKESKQILNESGWTDSIKIAVQQLGKNFPRVAQSFKAFDVNAMKKYGIDKQYYPQVRKGSGMVNKSVTEALRDFQVAIKKVKYTNIFDMTPGQMPLKPEKPEDLDTTGTYSIANRAPTYTSRLIGASPPGHPDVTTKAWTYTSNTNIPPHNESVSNNFNDEYYILLNATSKPLINVTQQSRVKQEKEQAEKIWIQIEELGIKVIAPHDESFNITGDFEEIKVTHPNILNNVIEGGITQAFRNKGGVSTIDILNKRIEGQWSTYSKASDKNRSQKPDVAFKGSKFSENDAGLFHNTVMVPYFIDTNILVYMKPVDFSVVSAGGWAAKGLGWLGAGAINAVNQMASKTPTVKL